MTRRPAALTAALTAVAVGVALGLGTLLVVATGGSPSDAAVALYRGSAGDASAWSQTLLGATPLLLVALGACVANRAGVFNVGQEGQLVIGAAAGCWVALHLAGPGALVVPLALLAAAGGGGAWAGISAVAHARRGANVVVTTLLLTFVGVQAVDYAVTQPWLLQQRRTGPGTVSAQSDLVPARLRLATWTVGGLSVGEGLVLAVGAAVVLAALLARSRWGFRLRLLGLSPAAALHAGIRAGAVGGWALALSGAFAGLAGGAILLGSVFRLQPALSDGAGWDGLLVALMARSRPLLVLPVALLFGGLRAGSGFLAATGVPAYLVDVVQALLVLAVVAPAAVTAALARRRLRSPAPSPVLSAPLAAGA